MNAMMPIKAGTKTYKIYLILEGHLLIILSLKGAVTLHFISFFLD